MCIAQSASFSSASLMHPMIRTSYAQFGRPFELELNDKIAAEGLQYDAYVQC